MAHEMVVGARRAPRVTSRRSRRTPTVTSACERGAVTAEAAAVLPLLLALAVGMLWLVSLAATHVKVVDAAREAARSVARGEAPPGDVGSDDTAVTVAVGRQGDRVTATATGAVRGPGGLFAFLPPVRLTSTAVAVEEPQ